MYKIQTCSAVALLLLSCGPNRPKERASPATSTHQSELTIVRDTAPRCTLENEDFKAANHDSVPARNALGGRLSSIAYAPAPPPYADSKRWFATHEPITYRDLKFFPAGLPVMLRPDEIVRFAEYDGIFLYVEVKAAQAVHNPGILFAPISPGCRYQPYYHYGNTGK